uniref:DNA-directed RNA polymerase subunit alpha n=1 Tax=Rhizochromulina marina TaxID=1034831 RepID=A0A514CPU2_9STRA|nr:RNA polymerase alpha subunit [Rhizochromulina marina]QDH81821.1 RNA polymerase alpha subunit [Rhizochromulina marina]
MTDFKFQCLESTVEESGKITSKFLLRSLRYGQGITIGNALRRVLLSDIMGTAITAVKIPTMVHEFSTVDGIREDILEIFLNLKQVILKRSTENLITGAINIKGPGIITASHIKFNKPIQIVNPNQYIATLGTATTLIMELKVESDVGYRLGEQTKEKNDDFLSLDAVFMPVINVNYKVNTEYEGNATSKEYLIIEITTNGSLTPAAALNEAATYLVSWFQGMAEEPIPKFAEPTKTKEPAKETILIEELQLPVRAYNCLKRVGIKSIEDLMNYTQEDIRNIKNFGKKSAQDVFRALETKFDIVLPTVNTPKN